MLSSSEYEEIVVPIHDNFSVALNQSVGCRSVNLSGYSHLLEVAHCADQYACESVWQSLEQALQCVTCDPLSQSK